MNVDVLAFVDPEGYGSVISDVDEVIPAQVELRQMIALLSRCDLLVCNDSGPMHIAGALGVPTVAIFGSGINRQFAPLGDQHQLVTAGLDPGLARDRAAAGPYDDVSDVPISRVLDAVERGLLKAVADGAPRQQARILLKHGRR
jgi:ADP-heptose:LPS heptosyltransferase